MLWFCTLWTLAYKRCLHWKRSKKFAAATNNYWRLTGVQLEIGSEHTEFETNLTKKNCHMQGYYQQSFFIK